MIRPLMRGVNTSASDFNIPFPYGSWGSKNYRIFQNNPRKRWGYNTADRSNLTDCQQVVLFQVKGGTRYTLYLTDTDLCQKETASGKTWSYKTDTYTTGTVTDITGTTVTGSGTTWTTNAAASDAFIMDDDHTSDEEPDANWGTIASVTDDTHLELSAAYTKNGTGYKIRRVYSTPTNERMWWTVVDDKFCFGNGDINVQKYTGSGYASDLNATTAVKARCGIEFANRLVIADYGSTRNPQGVGWSKNGDPTDWTDATAGSTTFIESRDYITGLGKSGANLIVYFRDGIRLGYQSGVSSAPIKFTPYRGGIGSVAAYGIVEANGTNYFPGREDFFEIQGDRPVSMGDGNRDKFFDIVGDTELERTFGFVINELNLIIWIATTSEGKFGFAYDYRKREWDVFEWAGDLVGFGRGAL